MKQARQTTKLQGLLPILLIAFFYVGLVTFLPPFFEFPLNDDVAYAEAVEYFIQNQSIKLSDWIAVSFVFQLLYGAVFSAPFGFSFSALRVSTLLLSFVGTEALFLILKELRFREDVSLLGALVLAANPVYLNLSYTFMTDVPFLSMTLLSVLFYLRGIMRDSDRYLVLGSLFAVFASLIRQPGIILPLAVLTYYLLSKKTITLQRFSILFIFPGIAYGSFLYWLNFVHGMPQAMGGYVAKVKLFQPVRVAKNVAKISFTALEYLGLFLVPLTLPWIPEMMRSARQRKVLVVYLLWILVIVLGVGYNYVTQDRRIMPYSGNILNDFGLGPFTLMDTVLLQKEKPVALPRYAWGGITILSSLSAVAVGSAITCGVVSDTLLRQQLRALIGRPLKHEVEEGSSLPILFIYIVGAAFWLSIVLTEKRFDRYFLILLLPSMLPLLEELRKPRRLAPIAVFWLLIFGIFGTVGTRDYISWNEARWKGIHYLLHEKQVSPAEIDGGYEFNYWYNYEEASARGIRWWWALDDKYAITFSPLTNYMTIRKIKYSSYLGGTDGYIYVLERQD